MTALGIMKWHTIALELQGPSLSARIDRKVVGTAMDGTCQYGPAGLAVGVTSNKWGTAQFDNLDITPLSAVLTPHTSLIVNRATGQVIGVAAQSTENGAPIDVETWGDSSSQRWQLVGDGSGTLQIVNVNSGKPLVSNAGADTPTQQSPSATGDRQWSFEPTGAGYFRLQNQAGFLDVPGSSNAGGTSLDRWQPSGGSNQSWELRPIGDGYFTIVGSNGLLVDVGNVAKPAGSVVVQSAPSRAALSQQWALSTF